MWWWSRIGWLGRLIIGLILLLIFEETPKWLSTNPDDITENWSKYLVWVGKMLALILPDVLSALTSETGRWAFVATGALIAIGLATPWKNLPIGHRSRLRLFVAEGDPYVRVGVLEGDPDLIYSIAIEATPGPPITGIKVVVDDCEPPGLFALSTPMQVMHGGFDSDLTFRLAGGEKKHPQLLEVRTKRRKTPQILPSHIYKVADRAVTPDTYIVTVKATSQAPADNCSQRFQIVVQHDLRKPVRIAAI